MGRFNRAHRRQRLSCGGLGFRSKPRLPQTGSLYGPPCPFDQPTRIVTTHRMHRILPMCIHARILVYQSQATTLLIELDNSARFKRLASTDRYARCIPDTAARAKPARKQPRAALRGSAITLAAIYPGAKRHRAQQKYGGQKTRFKNALGLETNSMLHSRRCRCRAMEESPRSCDSRRESLSTVSAVKPGREWFLKPKTLSGLLGSLQRSDAVGIKTRPATRSSQHDRTLSSALRPIVCARPWLSRMLDREILFL
jgi:hypothetical protein